MRLREAAELARLVGETAGMRVICDLLNCQRSDRGLSLRFWQPVKVTAYIWNERAKRG